MPLTRESALCARIGAAAALASIICPGVTVSSIAAVTLADADSIQSVGSLDAHPDGKRIAMEAQGAILVMALATKRIIKKIDGENPHWSPDGSRLAFYSKRGGDLQLYVWDVQRDRELQLTSLPGGIFVNSHYLGGLCDAHQMSWSADSRQIAFMSIDRSRPTQRLAAIETKTAIVHGANYPISRSLVDGLFATRHFWAAQMSKDAQSAQALTAMDRDPEVNGSRIHVTRIEDRTTRVLPGSAVQYLCPAWSPTGEKIAAVADVTSLDQNMDAYGYGFGRPSEVALTVYDARSGAETRFARAKTRTALAGWSRDGSHLISVVESNEMASSFKRLAEFSLADGVFKMIETPGGHAVNEIREGSKGGFILKLAGRFVETLWKFDSVDRTFKQKDTFDWSMEPQPRSFDVLSGDAVIYWVDSRTFKGRLVVSRSHRAHILYDANPQTAALDLGEQVRATWKNTTGDDVDGIVIFPPQYEAGRRYPVIVNAYPVPALDNFRLSASIESTGQLQAVDGYIVFRPAIRAPQGAYWYTRDEGYQEKARGAKGIPIMVDDFESGLRYLINQGWADPARIGIYGHSNGGWVANMLITESKMITAAVIQSGVSNMAMGALWPFVLTTRDKDPATGGNVFDNLDDYIRLSPIFKMREVNIPVLLLLGEDDWFWVPQMMSQYSVLRSENKNVTLVRYPHESHSLRGSAARDDARVRMSSFFERYLKAPH